MSDTVLASKMANALFTDARSAVGDIYGAIDGAVEQQRRVHGGLWVGGKAELTATRLRFAPNAVNKLAHVDGAALTFDVPLRQVTAVRVAKAFVTNIVEVDTPDGSYKLRCWGAADLARAVDSAVRAARG